MTTEANGLKMWTKRIVLATAVLTFLGLVANYWTDLGLPVPASAADVDKLDKNQATLAIEFYRDREYDSKKERREYRRWLLAIQEDNPGNLVQQHRIEEWIAEIDIKIQAAQEKRMEFEERKLELERSRK